jgi:hypothetical protein
MGTPRTADGRGRAPAAAGAPVLSGHYHDRRRGRAQRGRASLQSAQAGLGSHHAGPSAGRSNVAKALPEAPTLVQERYNFRRTSLPVRMTSTVPGGNARMTPRARCSTSLSVWEAGRLAIVRTMADHVWRARRYHWEESGVQTHASPFFRLPHGVSEGTLRTFTSPAWRPTIRRRLHDAQR